MSDWRDVLAARFESDKCVAWLEARSNAPQAPLEQVLCVAAMAVVLELRALAAHIDHAITEARK